MDMITNFLITRLLRTEVISVEDEPTQENFDLAYEADIEQIVKRIIEKQS